LASCGQLTTPEQQPSRSDHQESDADQDAAAMVALAETAEKLAHALWQTSNLDPATSLHLQQGFESRDHLQCGHSEDHLEALLGALRRVASVGRSHATDLPNRWPQGPLTPMRHAVLSRASRMPLKTASRWSPIPNPIPSSQSRSMPSLPPRISVYRRIRPHSPGYWIESNPE